MCKKLQREHDLLGPKILPIDVDHLSHKENATPDDLKAVGWFRPSFERDAIWARDVEWTPWGSEAIKNNEFRFTSPVCGLKMDGTIMSVMGCAITNQPGTFDIGMLGRQWQYHTKQAAKATKRSGRSNSIHDPTVTLGEVGVRRTCAKKRIEKETKTRRISRNGVK